MNKKIILISFVVSFQFRGLGLKILAGAHAHVLNCAAEGVGDNTLLYVLLAQTKIG